MDGYYCINVYSLDVKESNFFERSFIPPDGFKDCLFKYRVREGDGFVRLEEYVTTPLFKVFCVPKKRVEELVPKYREKYRGKRIYGKRLRERIVWDIYNELSGRGWGIDVDILEIFRDSGEHNG